MTGDEFKPQETETSYKPSEDSQFTAPGPFGFGEVLSVAKKQPGAKFFREGWNGKGQYISLQVPDEHSDNTLPYFYIITVRGERVPWLASQTDLLAEDWRIQ